MILLATIRQPFIALLLSAVIASGLVRVQADEKIELMELKTSLDASAKLIVELQAQVAAQRSQAAALTSNLASANAQATNAREQYERLRGVIEGLGVGALSGSTDEVQARLLAALGDLRLVDDQKRKLTEALINLSEAAIVYAKASPSTDEVVKKQIESNLAAAEQAISGGQANGAGDASPRDIHNAQVVSIKPEGGIAIFNVGTRDGVRVGMPFQVFRGDKVIARAMVVDVRKGVCGAIVQELLGADNPVKTGDRGEVDPTRTF